MKLLVFILNKAEAMESAMEAYVEAGISGATILDSEGLGHYLAYDVPLFASFQGMMKGTPRNKTILSLVESDAQVAELVSLLKGTVGDLGVPGTGVMFTLPVDWTSLGASAKEAAK